MQKTKIEWTDYVFNPIKGLCPVGCFYCYARKMYKPGFFSSKPPFDNPEIRYELDDFNALTDLYHTNIPNGSKIFVCSTYEIFHPKVEKRWRDEIFSIIEKNPKIIFQILTKMPENVDSPMPDNVWLGVSIDGFGQKEIERSWHLRDAEAKIKFISFEPLLKRPRLKYVYVFDWAIVGRLTGCGKKYDPKRQWIERFTKEYEQCGVPIFLKNNLKEIWGEKLIQEFPR